MDRENRWIKLASLIPWGELAAVYSRKLQSNSGRLSVDIRTVIAALIVKHKLRFDDRGTIQMIQENIYLQYFCGLESFTTQQVFDASLFVDIRKRLGGKEFEFFNQLIIEKSETIKPAQVRIKRKSKIHVEEQNEDNDNNQPEEPSANPNRGTLKADATVADQEIKFPTDLNLLSTSRENLERMIDLMYNREIDKKKPRTYRRKARKEYLKVAKKRRKSAKEIHKGLKAQLQYIARDLKITGQYLQSADRQHRLTKRDKELLSTIEKVYQQQKWMHENKTNRVPNRIVNIFQPWVRPIVRGKEKNKTEFGSKINVSEVNGFTRIDRLSWEAYNESKDLRMQVENYYKTYGCYPVSVLVDQIYLTRENRKYLKEKGIKIYGRPLGRPSKKLKETAQQRYRKRRKAAERNHIEAKFGQAKRGYGLNNIKARLPETSESWINAIFFVMNLTKLLQLAGKYGGFFVLYLKQQRIWIKKLQEIIIPQFLPVEPVVLLISLK